MNRLKELKGLMTFSKLNHPNIMKVLTWITNFGDLHLASFI